MHIIVGLGNPGEDYEMTRHNAGRMIVDDFNKSRKFPAFIFDKKSNSLKSEGKIKKPARNATHSVAGGEKILLLLPETMMNNSGNSLVSLIPKIVKKKVYPVGKRNLSYGAENLTVIHDDLDLSLGKFKISFARGSAGHKGVESVIKKIKTEKFIRIRVGTSPKKPARNASRSEAGGKPEGKELIKFLMGKFTPKELLIFRKTSKKITSAIEAIITDGLQQAMNSYN